MSSCTKLRQPLLDFTGLCAMPHGLCECWRRSMYALCRQRPWMGRERQANSLYILSTGYDAKRGSINMCFVRW
jgi:hypothetical protein